MIYRNTDDVATAANSNKRTASEVCLSFTSFYFIKKAYSYPKHNKSVGNTTETKGAGVGFFTKASELKPLKPVRDTSSESRRHKDNLLAGHKSGSSRQKIDQWLNKSFTSQPLEHKDICEKKGPGEGQSGGNLGNISPGDSAGVKGVANVVVKYPSSYLKQGSNVSKVRTTN